MIVAQNVNALNATEHSKMVKVFFMLHVFYHIKNISHLGCSLAMQIPGQRPSVSLGWGLASCTPKPPQVTWLEGF